MYALLTAVAGLVLLPFLLHARFPYLWPDLQYVLRGVGIALRMRSYAKRAPCYTVLDRFLDRVRAQPGKAFLVHDGGRFSYLDVDRRSSQVARVLSRRGRLREGDTAAVFMGNEPAYVWVWLGLAKLGCVASLLNCNIRAGSLLHCFSCCGAKVLIVSADLKEAVEGILPTLLDQKVAVFVLSKECDTVGIEALADELDAASEEPLSPALRMNVTLKTPALYIYTSGTTGLPKAAVINHERMWLASFMQTIAGVTSSDVIYIYLPLYHSAGFLMGLTGAIDKGITVVLKRKFSASQFWNDCRRHNVTVIQYIGEIMRYLCNTPKKDNDKIHSVRLALGNGIRSDTWTEFLQRFGGVRICECYGATEGNIGFVNYTGKIGAIGKVLSIHKVRKVRSYPYAMIKYDTEKEEPVRDSRGLCVEVPLGETGLLVAKITKSTPFSGYANKEQTKKKILTDVFEKGDLYFNSGDLLRTDHEGFIYFQDRIGDTFRWKGENVATTEVTDVMIMLGFIEEANVYGVRVPGHEGRIGMASLKLTQGMKLDLLATYEHIKTYLPSYAIPRFLRIQNLLDVTGTFKQMKVKLAEEGFDPAVIRDSMYFLEDNKGYVPMTKDIYSSISEGRLRL
uniref:long-chain-fatty-acid--CoA ligase n=1 Tax=Denticeps clupeoides TaxID=299321 RepID=A0AAY4DQW0_9TELE